MLCPYALFELALFIFVVAELGVYCLELFAQVVLLLVLFDILPYRALYLALEPGYLELGIELPVQIGEHIYEAQPGIYRLLYFALELQTVEGKIDEELCILAAVEPLGRLLGKAGIGLRDVVQNALGRAEIRLLEHGVGALDRHFFYGGKERTVLVIDGQSAGAVEPAAGYAQPVAGDGRNALDAGDGADIVEVFGGDVVFGAVYLRAYKYDPVVFGRRTNGIERGGTPGIEARRYVGVHHPVAQSDKGELQSFIRHSIPP